MKSNTIKKYADIYRPLHENEKRFRGSSILKYAGQIKHLVIKHDAKTLLDYGCGKGYQYLRDRIHTHWNDVLPFCYDVGLTGLSVLPATDVDGVICCDVLEHIEECDVDEVVEELFVYARRFIFVSVDTGPSSKPPLPDGRNLHLTQKPLPWWRQKFSDHSKHYMYSPEIVIMAEGNGG